ncbi:MAG: DUF4384 domain-containing protein [Gammaproteobacteria bacterium]
MLFKSYTIFILLLVFVTNAACAGNKYNTKQKINIEITSHLGDKQSFFKDDVIKFLINLDVDAYITVVYQTAEGQLIQLLPNQKEKTTLYKAGLFISVPSDNVPYQFTIQAPYGNEKVWVFASDKPVKQLAGKILQNGLTVVSVTIPNIKNQIQASSIKHFGQSSFALKTENK